MFTTVQRLLTAGRVTKLVDARDDRELVILRSNCGGSLSDNIDGISALLAPAREDERQYVPVASRHPRDGRREEVRAVLRVV